MNNISFIFASELVTRNKGELVEVPCGVEHLGAVDGSGDVGTEEGAGGLRVGEE